MFRMYLPYLRGRQFELIALRELLEADRISPNVLPVIEPVKASSTLLKTLECFVAKGREVAVVFNPTVGDFENRNIEILNDDSKTAKKIQELITTNDKIIKTYIMNPVSKKQLQIEGDRDKRIVVITNRDYLDNFLATYEGKLPRYAMIPDNRSFRGLITANKVLFEDNFKKQPRNVDYLNCLDEFFSDSHLFYESEGYSGFGDYSVVGEDYNESGFAPIAVALHIVYFDDRNALRIHHFVSDSNDGIENPAGKFGEALSKLVEWCDQNEIPRTLGLQGFYDCHSAGKYPGLGSVKKYSIMHHIELVSDFLGGK